MSNVQPLATPVFKLKEDSELYQMRQAKETALKQQDEFFDTVHAYLREQGCSLEEAQDFAFYNSEYFGWFDYQVPKIFEKDLRVPDNKYFRAVRKRTSLYQGLADLFKKYEAKLNAVEQTKMAVVVTYQQFYTRPHGISGYYVEMPQKIKDQYFIGGENVDTTKDEFKDNYELFDYAKYLKLFADAVKE